jgi:hypothetical protein
MNLGFSIMALRHRLRKKLKGGPIIAAHSHCNDNRQELAASEIAGCFYCCETYPPAEIDDWIDNGQCAMCPKCGIDSVIGSASGFPIHDKQFLKEMNGFWFS